MRTLSPHVNGDANPRALLALALAGLVAGASACSRKIDVVQDDFEFDGTCVHCHSGLSAGQVHPGYKLRCVDCHGGDDRVMVPEDASEDVGVYRDPMLVGQAHVRVKPGLARFFWANGVDDDGDGVVDEAPTFDDDDNPTQVLDFGEIAELDLHGEGVGAFIDAEYNRDLGYVRWLNPGDLRVATATCGSQSSGAFASGSGCHQRVVDTMRRSIMVNQSAVINGAYYGNESWRSTFIEARDALGPVDDPRKGVFGYVLDFDAIDDCIDTSPLTEPGADGMRAQPRFDSLCLEATAAANDGNAVAGAPGNVGLPAFEATQGSIGPAPDIEPGRAIAHQGGDNSRFSWGGTPLLDPDAALPAMHAVPDQDFELNPALPDPVDLVLRGFRAYYPLNYPGSSSNFNFTFGESIKPGVDTFKTSNPYGRGHSSGCTSCHMLYRNDGARNPQLVRTFDELGQFSEEAVTDPTTGHREFDGATQDIVTIEGEDRLVGMAVTKAQRDNVALSGQEREQQRFYSADHELTTRITTQQCGLCHAFVTRIDLAYQGMAEDEQRDALARNEPIAFTTPAGTSVRILSSWVREDDGVLVVPEGDGIADLARERDGELAAMGLLPGLGGCAPAVFTEDCNNNGELERALTLRRVDEDGAVVAEVVIDEDLNQNGALDLIDHAPREESVDGRQMRYVYGGANGAIRLMDIHFERGMHCIDCHMLQDTHGDGNLYHTNWDVIEIECEDCHGAAGPATLVTSGANGGNDLRAAVDHDGRPFFERSGDRVIQRSRVTPGLFWYVPQVAASRDPRREDHDPRSAIAHSDVHLPPQAMPGEHNRGSVFAGAPGESELERATLECYACHTSWIHNCMGCHVNINFGDLVISKVESDGSIVAVPGENETWFNNFNQAGRTNFQLLEFMRGPFILGTNAAADGHRLAPFRSSMQVHLSASDAGGDLLLDNMTFTTFQERDANSQRQNVATSGAALNQTLPHTVRPRETKSCEQCHTLVSQEREVQNDHILAQTYGLGTGRYAYVGDWALIAGSGGLEIYEYKENVELGGLARFPGIIVNPDDRTLANIEPVFDATDVATDVALIRNFTPSPAEPGGRSTPTVRDLSVMTVNRAGQGTLVISDITLRGHTTLSSRPGLGDAGAVFELALPDQAMALAHLAPDVSDPYVYIANSDAGLTVVRLLGAPESGTAAAEIVATVALPDGASASEIALAGDLAYVGTSQGGVVVFDLGDPTAPVALRTVPVGGGEVNGIDLGGFVMYVASSPGIAILDIRDPREPRLPAGAGDVLAFPGIDGRELVHSGGQLYVAAGPSGVLGIDVTTPARPGVPVTIIGSVDAQDVIVSKVPGQTWLLIADASGDLVGVKVNDARSTRERCLPDSAACGLDLDWRDPTIMGRDPDALGATTFRQVATIVTSGRRLARPAYWEKLGFQTGRRYRDSFMPGSGVLSTSVMRAMYDVAVCVVPGTADRNGNGLGEVNLATPEYFGGGPCPPYPESGESSGARARERSPFASGTRAYRELLSRVRGAGRSVAFPPEP